MASEETSLDMPSGRASYTAVVLMPPEDQWEPIQAIRRENDPRYGVWMPHVTLLYPFMQEADLDDGTEDRLREVCRGAASFTVVLGDFGMFQHASMRRTVWLRPEPPEPIVQLHGRLTATFPQFSDTSRYRSGFTPHLSVGQFPAPRAGRAVEALRRTWSPLRWHVDTAHLITRPPGEDAAFSVRTRFPLQG